MANALYLLVLLVSLSAADDACDTVECLPANGLVCAVNEETDELALFTNECVLSCANCRMDTEFKKVDIFRCSKGTKYVSVCPEHPVNNDNEDPKAEDPDDGIMVVKIDVGEGMIDKAPSMFGSSVPLPLPLLSMGREILRSLVMSSQPHPPPPPPGGVTLIRADVKVDVNIHEPHRLPPPPPPPPRFAFPPPPPLALPVALPPPLVLAPRPRTPPPPPPQYEEPQPQPQPQASSAAPLAVHSAAAAAVASLIALAVAALHI